MNVDGLSQKHADTVKQNDEEEHPHCAMDGESFTQICYAIEMLNNLCIVCNCVCISICVCC